MSPPRTMGWRTLRPRQNDKGCGTRLLRDDSDEQRSVMVREGYSGWKQDLTFIRLYRYDGGEGGETWGFYTIICLDSNDNIVATATGRKDAEVWTAIFANLRNKGYEVAE